MKSFIFSSLALLATLTLSTTAATQESEGRRMASLVFESIDTAGRGFIDFGEYSIYGEDVFVSMDSDQSGSISLGEFLTWDFGMRLLAQDVDREGEYDTALRVVFAFWDRDGDNKISKTEQRQSLMFDFQRADVNNDAILTEEEFLSGFSVMVALRAAINPAPVE